MAAFKEFVQLAAKYWQLLVIGGIFGVVGAVEGVSGAGQSALAWLAAALLALLVAAFLAFRKVWKEREATKTAPSAQTITFAAPVTMNIGTSSASPARPSAVSGAPRPDQDAACPPGRPTAAERQTRLIEGYPDHFRVVNAWDLYEPVPGQPLSIVNWTLRYVELRGPALLVVRGTGSFVGVSFGLADGETMESILWPPNPAAQFVVGPAALQDCVLEECRTRYIGFTGDDQSLRTFRSIPNARP